MSEGRRNYKVKGLSFIRLAEKMMFDTLIRLLTAENQEVNESNPIAFEHLIDAKSLSFVNRLSLAQCRALYNTKHVCFFNIDLRNGTKTLKPTIMCRLKIKDTEEEEQRKMATCDEKRESIKLQTRDEDKLPFVQYIPWDECIAITHACTHNVDADVRTQAVVQVINNEQYWRVHQDQMMAIVLKTAREQDSVRRSVLQSLSTFPLILFQISPASASESASSQSLHSNLLSSTYSSQISSPVVSPLTKHSQNATSTSTTPTTPQPNPFVELSLPNSLSPSDSPQSTFLSK